MSGVGPVPAKARYPGDPLGAAWARRVGELRREAENPARWASGWARGARRRRDVTAWITKFTSDSAYVWVSIVSGAGQHFNGPSSYFLHREPVQWHVGPHLGSSGGLCANAAFHGAPRPGRSDDDRYPETRWPHVPGSHRVPTPGTRLRGRSAGVGDSEGGPLKVLNCMP